MGCVQGKANDPNRLPNEDALVRAANAVKSNSNGALLDSQAMKLLLLGSGSSGKTTFRKQLRNIYVGFTEQQRVETASIIIENLWLGVKTLASTMQKEVGAGNMPQPQTSLILQKAEVDWTLDDESAKAICSFWKTPSVQAYLAKRPPQLQLQECVFEFVKGLDNYPAWGGPKWVPSADDCIRARVRSSGVAEEHFTIEGTTFKLFDAGGQRSERRKWIHYFDAVNSVLFMTSLTSYAETIFEDATQNGLVESLDLFDNISNSSYFRSTPMMLFFNKRDLLEEYLTKLKIPLNRSGLFPDAPDSLEVEKAIQWQMKKFRARKKPDPDHPEETADANIYCHVTTATSKDNVNKVFSTCRTIILKESLKKSGFVPM